jgi:RNA polymerase sigma factor (TIGR02999 family)
LQAVAQVKTTAMNQLTQILELVQQGDARAAEEILPLMYDELRKLAAHKLSLQPPGQTLQATALVHEAYLRLIGSEEKRWENRRHFFSAAAEAMRHILIDRARRRLRLRHGQNAEKVSIDEIEIAAPAKDEIMVQLNEALEELRKHSPEQAEIVNLRFFAGFSEPEIAEILKISERSVQRHWSFAKAWLFDRIETMKTAPETSHLPPAAEQDSKS